MADLTVETVTRPNKILECLSTGTSLPLLPAFHKYILRNLKRFNAKALVLRQPLDAERFGTKTNTRVGNALVYDDGGDTLFFGFFGVADHDPAKIDLLIDAIMEHAASGGYARVRGPINIPTVIFGWGFMVAGSTDALFVCCPVNPPVYQERFLKRGFRVLFEEDRYRCNLIRFDPYDRNNPLAARYDYSDYEYFNPSNAEEMAALKPEFVRLHAEYMPPSAQITPAKAGNADDIIEFVGEFGHPAMIWGVRFKPTNEIVACGYAVPNPFSTDKWGRPDSYSMHDWVVHPDHRRAGLAMLMYGGTTSRTCPRKRKDPDQPYTWGSWPVGAENFANSKAAQKMGGERDRTHLILQYDL